MALSTLRVLSNTPLPALNGIAHRHFGECFPGAGSGAGAGAAGKNVEGYRPERERRSLREILSHLPAGFDPDLLVFRSPEYLPLPEDLHVFPGPRVLLITDWNVCLRFLPDLCRLFDVCFVDAPGARLLRQAGVENVHAQPLFGHDPARFHPLDLPRDLDLSFCGNLNWRLHADRNRLLFRLARWGRGRPVHLRQAFGEEYLRVLNRSKLVFNYSVRGEANMRLYEAMACGAAVLVEKDNQEVPELFQAGEHYLTYDPGTLEEECEAYLADPDRLSAVGAAAREAVASHTQALQLERTFARALEFAGLSLSRRAANPRALAALKKMRILGAGYTLAEAEREIQVCRRELPELAAEALPAVLQHALEAEMDPARRATLRERLEAEIEVSALSVPLQDLFRMMAAKADGRWDAVLDHARLCLEGLEPIRALAGDQDPGYSLLIPPLQLGQALNGDLNRCYRSFLEQGDHEAFVDLFRNLVLSGVAVACLQAGRAEEAGRMASEMTPGAWREASPWPLLFAVCLVTGDGEALEETADRWLEDYPLDVAGWERILRGLHVRRPDLIPKFLDAVLPAAELMLPPEKLEALRNFGGDALAG